jgi:hypothetical protein
MTSVLVVVENTPFLQYAVDFISQFCSANDSLILFHAFELVRETEVIVPGACLERVYLANIVLVLKLGLLATVETINAVKRLPVCCLHLTHKNVVSS